MGHCEEGATNCDPWQLDSVSRIIASAVAALPFP